MRKSILASALLAAAAFGATAMPAGVALTQQPRAPKHRRAAGGPTNALKIRRAARKARNVKANRRNHRG